MAYKFTTEDRQAIVETATRLGIDPASLTMVMAYESRGMNPSIVGGKGNHYQGLIQFGPSQRTQYGYKPGMTIADQVRGPVYRYLADPKRGLKPGMGLAEIYSVINAGSLTKDGKPRWNANDGHGTIRQHVQRITQQYMGKGSAPPMNVGETAQGRQMPLGMGRNRINSGPEVAQLQQQLADLGFNVGKHGADGVFGKDTAAAVRSFEAQTGLTVDRGVAGPQVQGMLQDAFANIGRTSDIMSAHALAPVGPGYPGPDPRSVVMGGLANVRAPWEVAAGPGAGLSAGNMPGPRLSTAPFNVGAGAMPGAGALPSGFSGDLPAPGIPSTPLIAQSFPAARPDRGVTGFPAAYAPPSVYPDPNTFGEVRRGQEQLGYNEVAPGGSPSTFPARPLPPAPDLTRASRGLANSEGNMWDVFKGNPALATAYQRGFGGGNAATEAKLVPNDLPYSDAGAGGRYTQDWGQNAGVPSIGSLGSILNNFGGFGTGGSKPATAKSAVPPAVPAGGFAASDRYGPGAGLSAPAYPMASQTLGYSGIDAMRGMMGGDMLAPAGGESKLSKAAFNANFGGLPEAPLPRTKNGAGYAILPDNWASQRVPFGYLPPRPVATGATADPIQQAATLGRITSTGINGGPLLGMAPQRYGAASPASGGGGYRYSSNAVYTFPSNAVIGGGRGAITGSDRTAWTPSGYTPQSHTPYINNIGQTVDQNGDRVNVGYYSMNGKTHQFTY